VLSGKKIEEGLAKRKDLIDQFHIGKKHPAATEPLQTQRIQNCLGVFARFGSLLIVFPH
jgi:hypothetical protein